MLAACRSVSVPAVPHPFGTFAVALSHSIKSRATVADLFCAVVLIGAPTKSGRAQSPRRPECRSGDHAAGGRRSRAYLWLHRSDREALVRTDRLARSILLEAAPGIRIPDTAQPPDRPRIMDQVSIRAPLPLVEALVCSCAYCPGSILPGLSLISLAPIHR